jgi:hypothetical protein
VGGVPCDAHAMAATDCPPVVFCGAESRPPLGGGGGVVRLAAAAAEGGPPVDSFCFLSRAALGSPLGFYGK